MSLRVMIVEDNLADAKLTKKLLSGCEGVEADAIHISSDGEAALSYLRGEEPYGDRVAPELLFLDLNIPNLSGLELLAAIRSDADLAGLPVIILSSSAARRDINQAYELKANAYVRKPVDLTSFRTLVSSLEGFWFQTVRLPKR